MESLPAGVGIPSLEPCPAPGPGTGMTGGSGSHAASSPDSSDTAPYLKRPIVSESLDSGADLGCSWECDSGTASDDDDEDADDTLKVDHIQKALGKCQLERAQQMQTTLSRSTTFTVPKPSLSTTSPVYSCLGRQTRASLPALGDNQTQNSQAKKNLTNIWTSEDSCSSDISEPYSFDGDVDSSTNTEVGEDLELMRFAQHGGFSRDLYNYAPTIFPRNIAGHDAASVTGPSTQERPTLRFVHSMPTVHSSILPSIQSQCLASSPRTFPCLSSQAYTSTQCSTITSKILNVLRPTNSAMPTKPLPVLASNSLKRALVSEDISSEDEEICALLAVGGQKSRPGGKVQTPTKIKTESPALRSPQSLRSTPRKRHRSSDQEDRPSLNFDKMQRTVLHRPEPEAIRILSGPVVEVSKPMQNVRVVHVQTRGSRREPPASVCDPSKFSFRTISQECSSLPPVDDPLMSVHNP